MAWNPKELLSFGSEFVGKLNDKVYYYQKVRGIRTLFIRPYYKPVQPGTASQVERWNLFRSGVAIWQSLDSSIQDSFRDRVRYLGYRMTGFNLFMSIFLKGEFSMIKSIQCGDESVTDGSNNVTINPVVISKSIVLIHPQSFSIGTGMDDVFSIRGGELTSTNNLRIRVEKGANIGSVHAGWQVVEFV